MIDLDGWDKYNTWTCSASVLEAYRARLRGEVEEPVYLDQAVELIKPFVHRDCSLLDAGCGVGQFYGSLMRRNITVDYFGLDSTKAFVDAGKAELQAMGQNPDRLLHGRIEDLSGEVDIAVCLNVLSNIDNFHRPLERLLDVASRAVLIRESIGDTSEYRYVVDRYLDVSVDRWVYVNRYAKNDLEELARSFGYRTTFVTDRYSNCKPTLVIDEPHYWTFAVFEKD